MLSFPFLLSSLPRLAIGSYLFLDCISKAHQALAYAQTSLFFSSHTPERFDSFLFEQISSFHWALLIFFGVLSLCLISGRRPHTVNAFILIFLFLTPHHAAFTSTPQDILLGQFFIWYSLFSLFQVNQTPKSRWSQQQYFVYNASQLHLVVIYWNAVILKLQDPYWSSGEGAAVFIRLYSFEGNLADWIQSGSLGSLQVMNSLVIVAEFLLPLLVLIPRIPSWMKAAIVFTMMAFHISNAFVLGYVSMAMVFCSIWLLFLPQSTRFQKSSEPSQAHHPSPHILSLGKALSWTWVGVIVLGFVLFYLPSNMKVMLQPIERTLSFLRIHQQWSFASDLKRLEEGYSGYTIRIHDLEQQTVELLLPHDTHQKPHFPRKTNHFLGKEFLLLRAIDFWLNSDMNENEAWSRSAQLMCEWFTQKRPKYLKVEFIEVTHSLTAAYPSNIAITPLVEFECSVTG